MIPSIPTHFPVFTLISMLPITLTLALTIQNVSGNYSASLLSSNPQEPLCIFLLFLPLSMRKLYPKLRNERNVNRLESNLWPEFKLRQA